MIALLEKLISTESISGNEDEVVTFLESYLGERFPLPPVRSGNNLVLEVGKGTKGPTLLLCSHIDTVAVADGWTKDPFGAEREGDAIYGLGANDALASVVAMVSACEACQNVSGKIVLALVCEEERGSNGFYTLEPSLEYDFGIFGEPTDLKIGYCMRGLMRIKVFVDGKACHASRPWEGDNPILKLSKTLDAIRSLPLADDSPWGGATVQPTVIRAGESVNQIPDRVELTVDVRPTSSVNSERILDMLDERGISYEVEVARRKAQECPKDSELVQAIVRAAPESEFYGFGGSCDMAFATKPSIVLGPGQSNRSHTADEFITISELEQGKTLYQKVLNELLS